MQSRQLQSIAVLLALSAVASPADASEATTIGILRFQASQGVQDAATTAVEQFVYSRFTAQSRFRVLERSRLDAIQAERVVQDMSNVKSKTALADLGAKFVVLGEVTQADVAVDHGSGRAAYSATVAYGLRILDVSTGTVAYSQDFSNGRNNPWARSWLNAFKGDTSTKAGALDSAVQQTAEQLDVFLATSFPISAYLLSVESTDRKGLPGSVLVSLGPGDGIGENTKLLAFVSQELEVDGRVLTRKRPIAELEFIHSEGDHLSLFKVEKGGAELKSALTNQDQRVQVEVTP